MKKFKVRNTILLLGAMMLFSAVLSYFFFIHQSLRLDEAQSLWQSSRSPGDVITIVSQDVHVPLYHELLHFWRLFIGDSVVSARLLSLLFYLLSIPAIYVVGTYAYKRSVGLFAAFLLSISPFMNWYGNEIRMYTLFMLITLLNQYFFIQFFTNKKKETSEKKSTLIWIGYAITTVLGAFVHYFFFLNLLSQALFYFLQRGLFPKKSFRNFLLVVGILLIFFVPWIWFVHSQGQAGFQAPMLPTPSTVNIFNAFSQFLFGFLNDNLNTVFLSLWPITLIFGLMTLRRTKKLSPVGEYLLLSVVVGVSVAFSVSFIVPVFVSRYLIFTVPAIFLLLANLFEGYTPKSSTVARVTITALMLITLSIEIFNPTTPVKENYYAAAQFLNKNTTAQDVVVLSAPFTIYPVQYYYRGVAPLTTLPAWDQYSYGPIPPLALADIPTEVHKTTDSYQNVWLLLSYDQGHQKDIQNYFDNHYERLLIKNFSPGLTLYVYKLRYDTSSSKLVETAFAK